MPELTVLQWATAFFTAAALGGLTMAVIRFQGRPTPPVWLAVGHGLGAATGLAILLYACATTAVSSETKMAATIFVLAALGGFAMAFGYHGRNRALPIGLLTVHAIAAATGLGLLILSWLPR